MLVLYGKEETSFTSLGLGVLKDVRNDEVREVMNSQFELTLQYPVTGKLFSEIVPRAWIKARPNPLAEPQPFRIYRISKAMNGWVTVYARHLAYRLRYYVCEPWSVIRTPVSEWFPLLADHIYPKCPFVFRTEITSSSALLLTKPMDVWSLLGSEDGNILYGCSGEYEFDGYQVKLHSRRGADRGVKIMHGKNLVNLTNERNDGDWYTGVYPFCTDSEGNYHELPGKYYVPKEYAEVAEQRIRPLEAGGSLSSQDLLELGLTWDDHLEGAAALAMYFDGLAIKPGEETEQSLTIDFVQLSKTEEYKNNPLPDNIGMGDTVHVTHPTLGVSASARVMEIRYQPSLGRYKSIALGSVRPNAIRTIVKRAALKSTRREITSDDVLSESTVTE